MSLSVFTKLFISPIGAGKLPFRSAPVDPD